MSHFRARLLPQERMLLSILEYYNVRICRFAAAYFLGCCAESFRAFSAQRDLFQGACNNRRCFRRRLPLLGARSHLELQLAGK